MIRLLTYMSTFSNRWAVFFLFQVCNLVYVCLSRLYTHGDLLPLYSQLAAMQAFLQDKNSTASEVSHRQ